jgi:hypothetical protein
MAGLIFGIVGLVAITAAWVKVTGMAGNVIG